MVLRDNKPQFISYTFKEFCENYKIKHERIPPKTPNMNTHIESFHRIFKDDCLSRWQFETYAQAYEVVNKFMVFYNERRLLSSILDLSPTEFYRKQIKEKMQTKEVRVKSHLPFFFLLSQNKNSYFWNGIKGDDCRAKPLPLMEWKKWLNSKKGKRKRKTI